MSKATLTVADVRGRAIRFFGLTREIVAVSTAMFLMALGENLWRRFLPADPIDCPTKP